METDTDIRQAVLALKAEGVGRQRIARQLGITEQEVRKILNPDYVRPREAEREGTLWVKGERIPLRPVAPFYVFLEA